MDGILQGPLSNGSNVVNDVLFPSYTGLGPPPGSVAGDTPSFVPLHTDPLAPLQHDPGNGSDDESSDFDYLDGGGNSADMHVGESIISDTPLDALGGDDNSFGTKTRVTNSESAWSHEETIALIAAVRENYESIGKKKRNKLAIVWLPNIATRLHHQGYSKTAEQCHVKWKNLLHKFRELKEQSTRNRGRFLDPPRLWSYYKMIEEIVGKNSAFGDRNLTASRFVMYVPPVTKPSSLYTSLGTTIRPYPDVTAALPPASYYHPGPATVSMHGVGNGVSSTIGGVTDQNIMDPTGLKRTHDDLLLSGPSPQVALLSEKLDRVIYLLEKQIELQKTVAGLKRPRSKDREDENGEGLSDTETEI